MNIPYTVLLKMTKRLFLITLVLGTLTHGTVQSQIQIDSLQLTSLNDTIFMVTKVYTHSTIYTQEWTVIAVNDSVYQIHSQENNSYHTIAQTPADTLVNRYFFDPRTQQCHTYLVSKEDFNLFLEQTQKEIDSLPTNHDLITLKFTEFSIQCAEYHYRIKILDQFALNLPSTPLCPLPR